MEVRRLQECEFVEYVRLQVNAYPGLHAANEHYRQDLRLRFAERHRRCPDKQFCGVFRENRMIGGMLLHDFTVRLYGADCPLGGLGMVATDLLCKKEKVAKAIVEYFLQHYRAREYPLVALYPFRPDFYRRMGFGYGTKINRYRVKPGSFPRSPVKKGLRYLQIADSQAVLDCYNRAAARQHGMIFRDLTSLEWAVFLNPELRVVGVEEEGRLTGYMAFKFVKEKPSPLTYDLEIAEWIYETPAARSMLFTFLHTQADQVQQVVIDTQDDDFHHLLFDPRNGSEHMISSLAHESNTQGLGIMYRIVDVPRFFTTLAAHDFGGASLSLLISVRDSFLPENDGETTVVFRNGRPEVAAASAYDVAIELAVENLSALLMGTVSLQKLYDFGLVKVSDPTCLPQLDGMFRPARKPVCVQRF